MISAEIDKFEVGGSKWDIFAEVGGLRQRGGRVGGVGNIISVIFMPSAGARGYMGVWGRSPQWGPGAKPLVRGSGGRSPPEAGDFLQT